MAELENEKELENYLYTLVVDHNEDHPLEVSGKAFQQVELKGYGIMDLVYLDSYGDVPRTSTVKITIVELKKGKIDLVAVAQISRYKQAIERLIERHHARDNKPIRIIIEVEGILVGSGMASGDVCYLVDSIDWLRMFSYDLSLKNGLTFKSEQGWYNVDENLSVIPLGEELRDLIVSAAQSTRYFCREGRLHNRWILEKKIINNPYLVDGSL